MICKIYAKFLRCANARMLKCVYIHGKQKRKNERKSRGKNSEKKGEKRRARKKGGVENSGRGEGQEVKRTEGKRPKKEKDEKKSGGIFSRRFLNYLFALAMEAIAFSATFSAVKPNFSKSKFAGAEAPNVVIPTISPSSPAYLYQL